ncbi:MAG: hypothetical protein IJU29_04030 [Oscillospiraceae bacterium]|nr:hypothetical protein [Oscillospiraceae bacterium]
MNGQRSLIFTYHPESILDFGDASIPKAVLPHQIMDRIVLEGLEYENFIMDMRVERQFIEDCAPLCASGNRQNGCLLIQQGGQKADGILVIPENGGCVKYAAEYHDLTDV